MNSRSDRSERRGDGSHDAALPPVVLEVMLAHRHRLISSLADWLGSADAEDVLQEACLKALRKQGSLRRHESALSWFERIVRHTAIDHARHADAERRARTSLAQDPTHGAQGVAAAELHEAICRCGLALMSTLRTSYADVLRRVDLEGERIADVAATSGTSPNSIRVRLHRSRSALRARLLEFCGHCAERGGRSCNCDHRQTSRPRAGGTRQHSPGRQL
ncbi:MAG: RNA polymerase sigma factor [Deltaproteobacteria bacterium]|nr:RNA polymerase sigma factor [Deltaproteobacteria bacterium]